MGKRLLGVVLILSALAGCSGEARSDEGLTVPAATRSPAITDCGTFNLSHGEGLPDSAVQCLLEAVGARRPARLIETRPTVEGDPIPVTYVAHADGRVEVITDSRQDRFGNQMIERRMCVGPSSDQGRLSFAQCS